MHLIIEIGGWQCGPWVTKSGMRIPAMCDCTGAHRTVTQINVRNANLPHYMSRPPWAQLEFDKKLPQSSTETLRWAVEELYTRTRRPSWQNWELDDSKWEEDMDVRSGAS